MWMIVNANGYTLHRKQLKFDAIVIHQGRIVTYGARAEVELQFSKQLTRVLDVAGATVIPGLVDSHLHICGVGQQAMQLSLHGVQSKEELLDRVKKFASTASKDSWIVGAGWDDNRFLKPGLPTLTELDEASGGRPLLLTRVCCHAYLANSEAFARAGLGQSPSDQADGAYGRDETGNLNGRVYENAVQPIQQAIPPMTLQMWEKALRTGMQEALKVGLTAVHTDDTRYVPGFANTWNIYRKLIDQDGVRLRVHELVDWTVMDECLEYMRGQLADEWLAHGAAKLFSDGAMGSRTSWLLEDYSDAPGWKGTPMYSKAELCERVRIAHEKGFPVAIHAIGDAGLDATLAAIERAPSVNKRDRIVHAELVNPDLVARMVARGGSLAIDAQPRFTVSDFPWVQDRVGPERAKYVTAWRMLKNAGLILSGGSDAPIEPINPLLGIHAAVTRQSPFQAGEGYFMEEALTPLEAVKMFTHDACYADHTENIKGLIEENWFADLTILDRDIVNPSHPDDIRDAKILYTIVGGDIAYTNN